MGLLGRPALPQERADLPQGLALKPSGQVYKDLVFKQWWTDQARAAAADGAYKVRGFLGDYDITVIRGDKKVTQPLKLTRDGVAARVVLQ